MGYLGKQAGWTDLCRHGRGRGAQLIPSVLGCCAGAGAAAQAPLASAISLMGAGQLHDKPPSKGSKRGCFGAKKVWI